jgi:hypothetical protein
MPNLEMPPSATGQSDGYEIEARYAPSLALTVLLSRVGPTTLCAIDPASGTIHSLWLEQRPLEVAVDWVDQHNTVDFNIYFTLNLPKQRQARKPAKADIVELRGLAADIDAKDGRTLETAFAAIGNVGVNPQLIIASGGGFQPIWIFLEPLPATQENIKRVEAAGARTAHLTGGDRVQSIDIFSEFRSPQIFLTQQKRRKVESSVFLVSQFPRQEKTMNSQTANWGEC